MGISTSGNVVWSNVLSEIQANCTPQQFQTWFSQLVPHAFTDESLELLVPNQFTKETLLRKNFVRVIEDSARRITGRKREVVFVVDESQRDEPTLEFAQATELDTVTASKPAGPDSETDRAQLSGAMVGMDPPRNGSSAAYLTSSASELNPNYSFQNFIVGPSNRVPHAAALAVVSSPGSAYNPLFLHGSVGLGKTHLLQAICHALLQKKKIERFLYLSCETFVNHFISAIENGKIDEFRYNYRHVDMLLIDDVQFLSKKERTQEEFFHTFNTLYNSQKQIVFTCDSPPSELSSIQERLVSRFNWGLVTHLQLPDYETRVAIIKNKATLMEFELPEDVAHYTAERIESNIRDLEGAITKIVGYARLTRRVADLDLAREALQDVPERRTGGPDMDDIMRVVTGHFGVMKADLQSKRRLKSFTFPRQICMYLARSLTSLSLEEIGKHFGGRDHTTVMYAIEKISKLVESDHDIAYLTKDFEARIRR